MTTRPKNLGVFTIIIGVLTLILTLSVLAEKAHEAHLPEHNGRGTTEAILSSSLPGGIFILLSAVSGSASRQTRKRNKTGSMTPPVGPWCTTRDTDFAMQWPMR